jgi:hypothetical protein
MTPEQRQMRSKLGAHAKWAATDDRTAATEPARKGFLAKLAREIDPDGVMDPTELARRVENARRAHYQRMALKSSQARARRKAA